MKRDSRIRTMILDDDRLNCESLKAILENYSDLKIVGSCEDGIMAVEAIHANRPDLLFLDVRMPGLDGFSILEHLHLSKPPLVIFVTGHEQYAARAFEVNALDYLVKPIEPARLEQALNKARHAIERNKNVSQTESLSGESIPKLKSRLINRILINREGNVFFIKVQEIDWIEAKGKYVHLHCGRDAFLLKEGIQKLEDSLDPQKFLRIHKSTIVNIDQIQRLQALFHGEYSAVLLCGIQLTLSRGYRHKLFELMGKPVHGESLRHVKTP